METNMISIVYCNQVYEKCARNCVRISVIPSFIFVFFISVFLFILSRFYLFIFILYSLFCYRIYKSISFISYRTTGDEYIVYFVEQNNNHHTMICIEDFRIELKLYFLKSTNEMTKMKENRKEIKLLEL